MLTKLSTFRKIIAVIFLAAHLFTIQGCIRSRLYHTRDPKIDWKEVTQDEYQGYSYFVHVGDNIWRLTITDMSGNSIIGQTTTAWPLHLEHYKKAKEAGRSIKHKKQNTAYIHQVHLYTNQLKEIGNNNVEILKSDIYYSDIMFKAKGKTFIVDVLANGGIAAASIGIFLWLACRCPHVYTFDGNRYYLNNTLFTGALNQKLERHDYKIMPDYFKEKDDYGIIVKNEENERQFTDLLELIVVEHETGTRIAADQKGNIHSLSKEEAPIKAVDGDGSDISLLTVSKDEQIHSFNQSGNGPYSDSYFTFNVTDKDQDAKLVLDVKSNAWLAFVYDRFSSLFGSYYDNWQRMSQKNSRETIEAESKKAGIPLVVSIKKGDVWEDIEVIDLVGDANYNTIVVPIAKKHLIDAQVEIRLRTGFMFWDLDHLAMDFTENKILQTHRIKPTEATGSTSMNEIANLSDEDGIYMSHLKTGDSTNIRFTGLPVSKNNERTVYLHSKGYYINDSKYTGIPRKKELEKFKEAGALSEYSKRLYKTEVQSIISLFE